MILPLIAAAAGVVLGLPIALFGFMRVDERPGRLSWFILWVGLLVTLGPTVGAAIIHYQSADTGRYQGR